ncbi:hypothetical protein [Hydrogenophaga sp. 2FB]|uniref:hypothetical protein n=1 Tax=Hydrogenophaga sp. 2FB TaxID=2502187 RepID=UPI0010F58253|nr:hypothetical protein [Hydrogenophaga sp. 2FB]
MVRVILPLNYSTFISPKSLAPYRAKYLHNCMKRNKYRVECLANLEITNKDIKNASKAVGEPLRSILRANLKHMQIAQRSYLANQAVNMAQQLQAETNESTESPSAWELDDQFH